jgi:succinate dehydrogenase / fumarate reductase cytochrome b subunit
MPKATIQRKLFALSGVVPLGAFVAAHIVTTATGLGGQARFERTFTHRAWTTAALFLLVLLPLAFHAGYGAYAAVALRPEASLPRWQPALRRVAAIGTLVFVVAHVIELPGRVWTGSLGTGSLFDVVSGHLSSTWHGVPLVAVLYLAGIAATLTHFALELWVFFPAMGIGLADGARRALGWGLVAAGSLLFVGAGNTVVFFATGQRLLGPRPPAFVPDGPPPAPCSPN